MPKTIEQYQQEWSDLKWQFEKLNTITDTQEKLKQQQALDISYANFLADLESKKKDLQDVQITDTTKLELDGIIALENEIHQFDEEVSILKNEIVANSQKPIEEKNPTEKPSWIKEQRSNIWDTEKRHTDKKNNVLRTAWFAVTGVWLGILAYKWIQSLLWRWKKKKKKNWKETPRRKKALARWTGIVWWTWLWRGLLTGKRDFFWRNPFSDKKPDGPETLPWTGVESSAEAYEELTEDKKKEYENLATQINAYYGNTIGDMAGVSGVEDMLGDSEFETKNGKKIAGLIPFMMWNRYATVSNIISERAFYYEVVGTEGNIIWDKLKNIGLEWLKRFLLVPLAGVIDSASFWLLNSATTVDAFIDKRKTLPDAENLTRTVFRKSMSVISYMESRRRGLEYQVASEYLTTRNEDNFNDLDEDDKNEKILECLEDEERYKAHVSGEVEKFLGLTLYDSLSYLKQKDLLNGGIDELVKTAVTKIDDRKNKILWIEDDDDESHLEELKKELKEGKLTPHGKEKLQDICRKLEDDIDGFGRKSRYNQYLPILEFINPEEDTLEKILSSGDYDGVVEVYKDAISDILKKSDQWTLTDADFDSLETTMDDYYKFQKSLVATQLNLSETRDKNGNFGVRWMATFVKWGETCVRWFQMMMKWDTREKIKWGAMVTWWVVSLDLITGTLVSKGVLGVSPWRMVIKWTLQVWKFGIKQGTRLTEFATGRAIRAHLPYGLWARRYNEAQLRYALCNGELNISKAVKIANRKEWTVIAGNNSSKIIDSAEWLLRRLAPGGKDVVYQEAATLLSKYDNNPELYKQVFESTYENRKLYKPMDWLKLDKNKIKFSINEWALNKLHAIDVRISQFTHPIEKKIFQSMIKYAPTLDHLEDMVIMGIEPQYLKLFEQWKDQVISAEKFGKYLAQYAGKIDANDMELYQKFLLEAKNSNKIGKNAWLFIRNSLRNFSNLQKKWFALEQVETLWLNSSKRLKMAESTKANTGKMISSLEDMSKNVRMKPFWKGIKNQITALQEYKNTITPDGLKALKDLSRLDNVSGFGKLTAEGIQEMIRLKVLLQATDTGADLVKSLQWAKTLDAAKEVLVKAGIDVAKIDDTILLKIASTKNSKKIVDIVNYGAEFKTISGVRKLFANPAMRYAGRVLWKTLVVADFLFVGREFTTDLEEANRVKLTNTERGEWKKDQAYYELATWGLWAVAWACMFIPWAGWVAAGAIGAFIAAKEVWAKYYEDIEKFKQNYDDFSKKELPAIKQELVSINAWWQGLEHTRIDKMGKLPWLVSALWGPVLTAWKLIWQSSIEKKTAWLPTTTTEAVRALIYLEELQNNPLAYYDLNDPKVLNNAELKTQVEEAKKKIDEQVTIRFSYIKKNYIDSNKPLVDKKVHESNSSIQALDTLLQDSAIYGRMQKDELCTDKNNITVYKQSLESQLKKNEKMYDILEKHYREDSRSLFLFYAQLPYYKKNLIMQTTGNNDETTLLENADYLQQYIEYKMLGKPLSERPTISLSEQKTVDNDPDIDYSPLHVFLSTFELKWVSYEVNEVTQVELLTNEQFQERYDISLNLGQNILYEIAKKLNYSGKNRLDDLKLFFSEWAKDIHGIYYNGKNWYVNERWSVIGIDNKIGKDEKLNSLEFVEELQTQLQDARDSRATSPIIKERWSNEEYVNQFLTIIDSNLTLRKNQSWIKKELRAYLEKNASQGQYIALNIDLIMKWTQAGIPNLAWCLYTIQNWKLAYKTTLPNHQSYI